MISAWARACPVPRHGALAVKENQGQLYENIRDLFEGAAALGFDGVAYDYAQTLDKGHGRVERRECWVITDRDIAVLRELYGPGNWRKRKGIATVRLSSGRMRDAEVHWYEANGVGRKKERIKRFLE